MAQTFVRNRATWLAYLMLAFYGFLLNIFGPITPFLKNELGLSYTVSSFHFSAFAVGMIITGLTGYLLIDRIGRWKAMWVAAFGMALGALLLVAGRSPVVTIGAAFLMGLVGSLIMSVIPSTLADQHGEMRAVSLSEANVVASTFSAIAPLLVGWFALTVLGWRAALVAGVLFALALRFGFGKVNLPPVQHSTEPDGTRQPLPGLYWVYWAAIVMVVSVEFCMIFWSADYLEKELGMQKANAAQAVSLFLAGMIIGRLLASRLVQRYAAPQVVTGFLLVATAGFLIYWTATDPILGMAGLFVTGLGVAGLYPLILSLALGSAGSGTVRASSLASLASGVAIFSLPLILGRLADAMGIRPAYGVIILLLALALLTIQGTARFTRRSKALEEKPA